MIALSPGHAMRSLAAASLLALVAGLASPASAQVPTRVPLQGTLYDLAGDPIDGTLPVDFTLYSDASGTDSLWSDTMNVQFVGGIFTAFLGAGDPIDPSIFALHPQVFVGIAVDGDSEMPLFALATTPYAAMAAYAGDADTLDGFTVGDILDAARAASDPRYAPASHTHAWTDITAIPAGFADGVDNVLDEATVDGFVADNGFLTRAIWADIVGIPGDIADGDANTQLSEAEVDAMVADNGYLTSVSWGMIGGIPSDIADGDANTQLSTAQVRSAMSGVRVSVGSCSLTGNVNSWDAVMNYQCPNGQVMGGMYSVHDNGREDRQFRFYCCTLTVD